MASYLPVYCESCRHASLSLAAADQEHSCSFCEGSARVIPGPIYGDGDWLAFAEIDKGISEADLDGGEANLHAQYLQQMVDRRDAPLAVVQEMIVRVPALANSRLALVNELPRGLRILMTVLIARSRDVPPRWTARGTPHD